MYRLWFHDIGYKNKDDKAYLSMININGYIVEVEEELKVDSRYTIYPFTLCARWDRRTLHTLNPEQRKVWVDSIRSVLCYSDIYKTYELGVRHTQSIHI